MSVFNTYFTQFCPVCGRPVRVPVLMLAKAITCRHCHATFVAQDDCDGESHCTAPTAPLMVRVEALLANTQAVGTHTDY